MVQTLGVNASNDLYLGPDNNLVLLKGVDAIVQDVRTACLTQLGECVLENGVGLPNFQMIWVGTPDYALWESYLQQTILNVEGVTQVNSVTLAVRNNVLSFTAVIQTIYSPLNIPVSGEITNNG
jgi:hypothetical protein